MTDHEVGIFDGDPERVVSVTVGELKRLCEEMYAGGVEYEEGGVMMCGTTAEHAIVPERTCHIVLGDESNHAPHCDACGGVVYEMMPSYCPYCGRRVANR